MLPIATQFSIAAMLVSCHALDRVCNGGTCHAPEDDAAVHLQIKVGDSDALSVRSTEMCDFEISATPEWYPSKGGCQGACCGCNPNQHDPECVNTCEPEKFAWSGPRDSTFDTAIAPGSNCPDEKAIHIVNGKGDIGPRLSCANQGWTIDAAVVLQCSEPEEPEDGACSWKPLGSVALQSHHDSSAVDIDVPDDIDATADEESGCQALCQSISDCVGYSWRSGGKTTHKHYHRCFLVSKVGKGNVHENDDKGERFTSALCEQRLQESAADCFAGPKGNHGDNQIPVCGCKSSSFPQDSTFCLNGETLTVKSSFDSVIPLTANAGPNGVMGVDQCIGSTVNLDSASASGWSLNDKVVFGACPS